MKLRKEELVLELRVCLGSGPLGQAIFHPLVHEIFYTPEMNSHYNDVLAAKRKACEQALADKEYSHYIFMHERPYRVQALDRVARLVPAEEYWSLVASVWMDSENIWQNRRVWNKLLKAKVPHPEALMTEEEKQALASLPDPVPVYRGCTKKNANGLSWTTDREKAHWFATRLNRTGGMVREALAPKAQILAFLTGRSENEVIWIAH